MKFFFSLHIFLSFRLTLSFLDLDELKTINYGIDILDKPVVIGQDAPAGAIFLTSKFGQSYQCSYPDRSLDEKKEKEDEKVAMETGIPELLKPMESGPCLVHTKGWWSYEFCYGKEIKQYHMEDGKITGTVIYLGYYESEFDWGNSTEKSRSVRNRLNRYHSQQYVNGSKCDLTSTSRRTEVRFQCEDGSGDYISRVDEPETCVYILTVHTTKICHHPYLKPPSPNKPVPITCNPLLTEAEYELYLEETQVETTEEDISSVDPNMEVDNSESVSDIDTTESLDEPKGPVPEHTQDTFEQLFMESLLKGLGDALQQQQGEDTTDNNKDINVKQVKDVHDLEKIMTEMLKETKKKKKENNDDDDDDEDDDDITTKNDGVNDLEDSDSLQEFEEGLTEMGTTSSDRARLAQYKDNIRSAVEAQFDDILEEAEAEIGGNNLAREDRKEAFTHLSATLNQLLSKLDEAEKNLAKANEALDAANARQEREDEDTEEEDREEGDSDFTVEAWDEESSSSQQEQHQKAADFKSKSSAQTETTTIDKNVRVRVTRIKHEESNEDSDTSDTSDTSGIDTNSDSKDSLEIPAEKKSQLEETVKNQLQKAGLKSGGSKVHVKIITAGYYDDDEDTLHILSDDDSQAFNKMIITILGGDDEEVKEMERQESMESAYNFQWNKNKQKSKPQEQLGNTGQGP